MSHWLNYRLITITVMVAAKGGTEPNTRKLVLGHSGKLSFPLLFSFLEFCCVFGKFLSIIPVIKLNSVYKLCHSFHSKRKAFNMVLLNVFPVSITHTTYEKPFNKRSN
ncbi:hypothetical protein GALMADRAFT_1200853 [Galerina marginata CBS 339.88]|uniref:Uncharacterized protein n=1 Tax=Galerina marginata (strain CBS 339.88) TaxID=685588 RepID=A0A067TBG5_GALM3|nr:hypothetical protein GALMADRAFT_1200853 [Galerina marginata CBS 339.88]